MCFCLELKVLGRTLPLFLLIRPDNSYLDVIIIIFLNSNFINLTRGYIWSYVCEKTKLLKPKKMQCTNLDRAEDSDAKTSRKKNPWADCLPLGAIFLAHLIKVYVSPTALSRHQLSQSCSSSQPSRIFHGSVNFQRMGFTACPRTELEVVC